MFAAGTVVVLLCWQQWRDLVGTGGVGWGEQRAGAGGQPVVLPLNPRLPWACLPPAVVSSSWTRGYTLARMIWGPF